jgi:hypothetical protein
VDWDVKHQQRTHEIHRTQFGGQSVMRSASQSVSSASHAPKEPRKTCRAAAIVDWLALSPAKSTRHRVGVRRDTCASLKPVGCNSSYQACRTGHWVPLPQPCLASSFSVGLSVVVRNTASTILEHGCGSSEPHMARRFGGSCFSKFSLVCGIWHLTGCPASLQSGCFPAI